MTELDYVVLLPSAETCVHRVLARSDHGFRDEAAARKMHDEFAGSTVDPRHVLTVGSDSVAGVVERISAAREAGQLRYSLTDG